MALPHQRWARPSLDLVFGALVIVLVDVFRVPLVPSVTPHRRRAGWPMWDALWPAAGCAMAVVRHVLWGSAEKAFIYFRF